MGCLFSQILEIFCSFKILDVHWNSIAVGKSILRAVENYHCFAHQKAVLGAAKGEGIHSAILGKCFDWEAKRFCCVRDSGAVYMKVAAMAVHKVCQFPYFFLGVGCTKLGRLGDREDFRLCVVLVSKACKGWDNLFRRDLAIWRLQGFSGVLQLLKDTVNAINGMFGTIFRHFVFRELKLYMTVGASDAAETAQLYGKTCAAVFPAMGLLTSTCNVKEYDCAVRPNFMVAEKTAVFRVVLSFRPIFATTAVVVLAFKLLFKVVFKLLKNKSKEPENKASQTQNANNIKEDKNI